MASTTKTSRAGRKRCTKAALSTPPVRNARGRLRAMLGKETKYGLGVIIRPTTLGASYGHSGFFPGYVTEMIYFPEHKIALAMQVNSSVPRVVGKPPVRFLVELATIIRD